MSCSLRKKWTIQVFLMLTFQQKSNCRSLSVHYWKKKKIRRPSYFIESTTIFQTPTTAYLRNISKRFTTVFELFIIVIYQLKLLFQKRRLFSSWRTGPKSLNSKLYWSRDHEITGSGEVRYLRLEEVLSMTDPAMSSYPFLADDTRFPNTWEAISDV